MAASLVWCPGQDRKRPPPKLELVLNWFEELKRLVPNRGEGARWTGQGLSQESGSRMEYRYWGKVLEELEKHGIRPRPTTSPELVHEFVSDLYRYELRRLRDRLRRGEIRKEGYIDHVVELRLKYPLVSLKPHQLVQ